MAITILSGIEDTLALILDCGNDLDRIESTLLPALRKLCSPAQDSENPRNTAGGSRTQPAAPSEIVLCEAIQGNVDPLSALDPAVHSLGTLYILAARSTHAALFAEQAAALLGQIGAFVQRFDAAQVQHAADKVTQLAASLSALGDKTRNPELALQLLQGLASKFVPRPDSITTLHPLLAFQYLKTARYAEAATMLLDPPLIDADTSITPLVHTDILQYFYYAALIYIKLDRLHDAIDALETCVSSPAVAASAIHMDAYKKLVLVQLLADGKTSPVPRYTSQVVTRTFKQLAQPYLGFVAMYESRSPESAQELARLAEEKRDAFEKDRNTGLVRRCLALHRQRRIQRLGEVYSALSLERIASMIGAEGADAIQAVYAEVQEIARKGWVHATVTPTTSAGEVAGDWVVSFDPFGGDSYTSSSSVALLEDKLKIAKQWQMLLQQRDRQLEKSHGYLIRGLKTRDSRTATGADAYAGADEFDDTDY